MDSVLTLVVLDTALSKCMETHPPVGIEKRLHEDAHLMSGLWAFMTYLRIDQVDVETIKPDVFAAIRRWSV